MIEILVALISAAALVCTTLLARVEHRTRELKHNGGSSIKDDITGLAIAFGHLQRQQDETRQLLDDHLWRTDDTNR